MDDDDLTIAKNMWEPLFRRSYTVFHGATVNTSAVALKEEAHRKYTDRPTITYSPLTGDKFSRSLMTPIPIQGFLFLIQSGYPVDFLFRIGVQTINGVDNRFSAKAMEKSADP